MKATGIIRRIDDLGRVVIPKEIRKSLLLKEGDALEIFISDDEIIFVPYRADKKLENEISRIVEAYGEDELDNKKYQKAISELKRIVRELK